MKIDKGSLLLKNDNILLQPLHAEDITNEYISGLNDPEVNKFLVTVRQTVQTRNTIEEYVISCFNSPNTILFGIFIKSGRSKNLIGTVHVSDIDFFHYSASVGICIFAKRIWKKGYASKSLKMVRNYLFEVLGLHYLEAGVYAKNSNSINAFTRAGFLEWYRVKDKFRLVNSFEEVIYFSTVNPSFNMSLFA